MYPLDILLIVIYYIAVFYRKTANGAKTVKGKGL
jgi:hypothetical protein